MPADPAHDRHRRTRGASIAAALGLAMGAAACGDGGARQSAGGAAAESAWAAPVAAADSAARGRFPGDTPTAQPAATRPVGASAPSSGGPASAAPSRPPAGTPPANTASASRDTAGGRDTGMVKAFDAIVVRPAIKTTGIFSEGGRAEVWFADDSTRRVLQMRSRLSFGSLSLHLRRVEP